MQDRWRLAAAMVVAGHLATAPAAALPLASAPPPAPRLDLVLVQSGDAMLSDRMLRLRQHRAILENALAPRHAQPAQPLEPQARPLQPPADIAPSEAGPPQTASASETGGRIDCQAAAAIVADYGFSDVRPTDCAGGLYTFAAMRDGTAYALSVTPDGEIAEVSRQ